EHLGALVHAIFRGRELGLGAGVQSLLVTVQALLPLVLGIVIAALVMSFLAGRRSSRASESGSPRADSIDVAAYAAVPFVAVSTVGDLLYAIRGFFPSTPIAHALLALGLGWAAVVWLCGL